MRTIIALLIGCLLMVPVLVKPEETKDTCPSKMKVVVERRLLPVLDSLAEAQKKNDWFDKKYEREFRGLLEAKDKASREARVALMDYYVGEGFGELLVCAVALDGKEIESIILLYEKCDIMPSRSPVSRNHSLPLRRYALEMLKNGNVKEQCTFD